MSGSWGIVSSRPSWACQWVRQALVSHAQSPMATARTLDKMYVTHQVVAESRPGFLPVKCEVELCVKDRTEAGACAGIWSTIARCSAMSCLRRATASCIACSRRWRSVDVRRVSHYTTMLAAGHRMRSTMLAAGHRMRSAASIVVEPAAGG